jgi:acetyl-CoA acetyltransferase
VIERFEHRCIISGIGQSAVGRRLGRSALDLTIEAIRAALDDAGLGRGDIDGLATYPGGDVDAMGFGGPSPAAVQDALRLELDWVSGAGDGPAQLQAVVNACMAVACGLARHVLVYRTVTEATAQGTARRVGLGAAMGGVANGSMQWQLPFGAHSAANWVALLASRHFSRFGTTREQLGQLAITARANAARNPRAVYREPMSLDDYLAARMISTPLGLFDCDVPVDGSTALVVSAREVHADRPQSPVFVEAVGTAQRGRPSWDQYDDLSGIAAQGAACHLWQRSSLRPEDVDFVELYDGFSFLALAWLEALGFCAQGEGGPFVEGGARIALHGPLPVNTHGGQLSAGRLHGFGHLHEACVQLRGEAGDRQVRGTPQVAVVTNGGGPIAGCMVLTAHDPR